MFRITGAKGFHITLDNGWTVSVQFGVGNYCDNYWSTVFEESDVLSITAEIAAWDKRGRWYKFEDGATVKGYCSATEVFAFFNVIAAL